VPFSIEDKLAHLEAMIGGEDEAEFWAHRA
jgi:hypothetical protein